jgi:zinc/manganese transport system substrate-binding protein
MRIDLRIRTLVLAAAALAATLAPLAAEARIKVVASTNDLASIASSVGGDEIEVLAIAKPASDVHRVEALPSYMVRVAKAQLYLKVGLGLDQWADAIIDGSRNTRLVVLDCSRDIQVLDKPTGKVDASMGDVHPNGNPHYWLDVRNGSVIAKEIAGALGALDPAHAADYASRAEAFAAEAAAAHEKGLAAMKGLATKDIVTYHASWVYLVSSLGLSVAGTIEPVPGIPPTASHLKELTDLIRARHVPVVIYEPYFSADASQFLARQTGVRVATLSPSCDQPAAGSYIAHFQAIYDAIAGPAGATPRS